MASATASATVIIIIIIIIIIINQPAVHADAMVCRSFVGE
jgi:hypothetical protein